MGLKYLIEKFKQALYVTYTNFFNFNIYEQKMAIFGNKKKTSK